MSFDEDLVIFETISGSRLYGISTDHSDTDRRGVCLEPMDCIIGLNNFEQYEDKITDRTIYGLKKFLKLALDNNPNVVELLFAPEMDRVSNYSYLWSSKIKRNRNNFLSKKIADKFHGYLRSELSRIERGINNPTLQPSRTNLMLKYGYDTKAASHVIRLCSEGISLLLEGSIIFPLPISDRLINIRRGMWDYTQFKAMLNEWLEQFEYAEEHTILPDKPDYDKINELCMYIYNNYVNGEL